MENTAANQTLGQIFTAYVQSVQPHSHREPLKLELVAADGELIWETDALIILKQIQTRLDDGVSYELIEELDDRSQSAKVRATCSSSRWWYGHEPRKFDDMYNEKEGRFERLAYTAWSNEPVWTDEYENVRLVDRQTGNLLKDEKGRNLAGYGWMVWDFFKPWIRRCAMEKRPADFVVNGKKVSHLAHAGEFCEPMYQDSQSGVWKYGRN